MIFAIKKKNFWPRALLALFVLCGALCCGAIMAGRQKFLPRAAVLNLPPAHGGVLQEKKFFDIAYGFPQQSIIPPNSDLSAAVVPHHLLAADLIAETFGNLQEQKVDTVVLVGPNHYRQGASVFLSSAYAWQTPYGVVYPDQTLLRQLQQSEKNFSLDETVLSKEHAVFNVTPFIKKTFPEAKIVPIIIRPTVTLTEIETLAKILRQNETHKRILLLGSVDFSHYQSRAQAEKDDAVSLSALRTDNPEKIFTQTRADSPATLALLSAYAKFNGHRFRLIKNSNSAALSGQLDLSSTTSYITGYWSSE